MFGVTLVYDVVLQCTVHKLV